ncbi:hypothetical protein JCM8547_006630 [Rhodosporidiobolus lusitaniae]
MAHGQGGAGDFGWSYDSSSNTSGGAGAVGGYSPAAASQQQQNGNRRLDRTDSEEVQALGRSLGLTGGEFGGPSSAGPSYGAFDPLDHARLSPSVFDLNRPPQFALPRFASGGPSDPFGLGVGVADPQITRDGASPMPLDWTSFGGSGLTPRAEQPSGTSPFYPSSFASTSQQAGQLFQQPAQQLQQQQQQYQPYQQQPQQNYRERDSVSSAASSSNYQTSASTALTQNPSARSSLSCPQGDPSASTSGSTLSTAAHASGFPSAGPSGTLIAPTQSDLESPIYAPYGSSVISVSTQPNTAYKMPPLSVNLPPSQAGPRPFNPSELGLPAPPPPGASNNFAGLYSASGFDMLGVLARVAARPNPQIQIGPVDNSCAFAVVDARRWDQPLVFVSDTFVRMTGYTNEEIIGRNCRFLQSPGGNTVQGAPRKYTDGNAAWHMRQHIQAGKESQSSLINYTKDGRPFINLVTIIPICWDTEEVAYFVGFQVDLVDQPNAILNRMRDGSYVVNYSLVGQQYSSAIIPNPSISDDSGRTVSMQTIENGGSNGNGDALVIGGGLAGNHPEPDEWSMQDYQTDQLDVSTDPMQQQYQQQQQTMSTQQVPGSSASTVGTQPLLRASAAATAAPARLSAADQMAGVGGERSQKTDVQLLDQVAQRGIDSLTLDVDRRAFHKLLLGEADDFVHVLSLKGSLLYCSPSVTRLLEYEPGELVGSTLSSLCHPSDVVPVMRQLKEASSISQPFVKLLYRIRRKYSGWLWIEAMGKLHIEPGKGRKCVIAVARPRDVAQMHWNELRQGGGLGDTEFFVKLGERGTVLHSTIGVQSVLGCLPQETVGCSLLDLALPEFRSQLDVAIQQAQLGVPGSVQYKLKNRKGGVVEVVTRFYPRHPDQTDAAVPQDLPIAPTHRTIMAQTNEVSSEQRKVVSLFALSAPVYTSTTTSTAPSPANSDATSSSDSSSQAGSAAGSNKFQSTFKTLAHPSTVNDNVFDELETRRPTSWQFELHQLQNLNKKLREEKEHLLQRRRKRSSVYSAMSRKNSASASDAGSRASSGISRVCQNCGRTDSPEWRSGPNGKKTLCNSCGLRWAKGLKQAAQAAATAASVDGSQGQNSPTSSTNSALAALAPLSISNPSGLQSPSRQYSFALPPVAEDGASGSGTWSLPPQS